jgi:hypothetical protein
MAEYLLYPMCGATIFILITEAYPLAALVFRETATLRRKKKLSQSRAVIAMTTEVMMMIKALESITAT